MAIIYKTYKANPEWQATVRLLEHDSLCCAVKKEYAYQAAEVLMNAMDGQMNKILLGVICATPAEDLKPEKLIIQSLADK